MEGFSISFHCVLLLAPSRTSILSVRRVKCRYENKGSGTDKSWNGKEGVRKRTHFHPPCP